MIEKSKKFKSPKWFRDLYKEAEEEEQETLEYLSGVVGYGPEWCKQNIGKCLEKLEPREKIDVIKQLNKADITTKYAWSRFYYENWDTIKDLISGKLPEYDSKKKIIEFPHFTIFEKILRKTNELKRKFQKEDKNQAKKRH